MEYNRFSKKLANAFFDKKYIEVIMIWEKHKGDFNINYKEDDDEYILDAVKESYYEVGSFKKSLILIDKQFRLLPKLDKDLKYKEESLKIHFVDKMSLLIKLKRYISYYRMKRQSLLLWEDEEYREHLADIEIMYYNKFIKINNGLFFFLTGLIVTSFFMPILDINISTTIGTAFNIIFYVGATWLAFLFIFRFKLQKWFVYLFRKLFTPKSEFSLEYLKGVIERD